MNALLKAATTAGREAWGLLVDDGATAFGILVAVGVAALLSSPALLSSAETVGWALFALVWLALAISLRRARSRFRDSSEGAFPAFSSRGRRRDRRGRGG